MIRLYAIIFLCFLCFFTALRFSKKPQMQQETKNITKIENKQTIKIYSPIHIRSKFLCLQTLKKVHVSQKKSNNSVMLQSIPKGQKICLNFPQNIPHTTLQITLKSLEDKWLRVTIMGDSVLLSGYVPLQAIRHSDKIKASDLVEQSSGGELLLNAPEIKSDGLDFISGTFSMRHILQIARDRLDSGDYYSVKKWLALAQGQDPSELEIYEIYAALLYHEGKKDESLQLTKELNIAKNKMQ